MIQNQKIVEQLRQKWSQFAAFDNSLRDETNDYHHALDKLSGMTSDHLSSLLSDEATPGAIPTAELDSARNLSLDFNRKFGNHQEARAWALEAFLDHPTFAVDGSQIKHDPDFGIPVAAVQVAWFENRHTRNGSYTKDMSFEILTPDDLIVEFNGDRIFSEQKVNARRFELEIGALCNLMQKLAGRFSSLPVALFDSSLVISFADRLQDEMRERHVNAMLNLLRCSQQTGIPIVGYIDSTYARDLTNMLACVFRLNDARRVHDAQLINDLLGWGARTPFFICARGGADRKHPGVLESFEEFRRGIGFVYLKTNSSTPARLEIPTWVYEKGLLDEVIDIVRAEVIVGNGYPYVIEAADATAVLTSRDREAFYAIFQRFVREQGIKMRISQKATSKSRRR